MLYRETGAVQPCLIGGKRHGKLDAVEAFLPTSVKRSPDMTMPELAALLFPEKVIEVSPQSLSRWPINKGFSFIENTSGKRIRQA